MRRAKVMVITGTRPEAITMAPVVRAFAAFDSDVETLVAATGQYEGLVAGDGRPAERVASIMAEFPAGRSSA